MVAIGLVVVVGVLASEDARPNAAVAPTGATAAPNGTTGPTATPVVSATSPSSRSPRPHPRVVCHDIADGRCQAIARAALTASEDPALPWPSRIDVWASLLCGSAFDCPPDRMTGRNAAGSAVVTAGSVGLWVNVVEPATGTGTRAGPRGLGHPLGTDRLSASPRAFILHHTALRPVPGLETIRLHLADDAFTLWHAVQIETGDPEAALPYWAFAWGGGLAIGRYLREHPEAVRGRRVFDLATGSGLCAIAAMQAGAPAVTAADIDPFAVAAVALNARANRQRLTVIGRDVLDDPPPDVDVILAGDCWYEARLAERVLPWLLQGPRAWHRRPRRRSRSPLPPDRRPGRASLRTTCAPRPSWRTSTTGRVGSMRLRPDSRRLDARTRLPTLSAMGYKTPEEEWRAILTGQHEGDAQAAGEFPRPAVAAPLQAVLRAVQGRRRTGPRALVRPLGAEPAAVQELHEAADQARRRRRRDRDLAAVRGYPRLDRRSASGSGRQSSPPS